MKVSIITVTYNSAKTLKESLQSVLTQSYQNIEYIIVDGNSNDQTLDIIKEYEKDFYLSEKEYKWISENDNGIYDAINKGIQLATGDVIGLLNSDDFLYDQEVIRDIVTKFAEESPDCIYGNLVYVDQNDLSKVTRRWHSNDFKNGLFEKSWTPAHPTFYCKREIYEKYGLYRTDLSIAADGELMYRYLENHQLKSKYIDRYMVVMRQGGVSTSGIRSTLTITKEMKKAINENGGNFKLAKYLFYKGLKIRQFLVK